MLANKVLLICSCFLVTAGIFAHRASVPADSAQVKSAEDYWADTGLTPEPLEDLIQDENCRSSERYFLACANAILTIANRHNLSMDFQGELIPIGEVANGLAVSEKTQLEAWRAFFLSNTDAASKLSFCKAWKKLEVHFIPSSAKSLMVGVGLNGFISVFRDPHTYLMPVSQFNEVVSKADNHSSSLGLILGLNQGQLVVRKVTEGSPAKNAGIARGDRLLAINGKEVLGVMQARVSDMLKGQIGDKTTLIMDRGGELKTFILTRVEITVSTVSVRVLDGIKPVSVISINKFAKGTCGKVKDALLMLKKSPARGLLLDLRDNPGGQMDEASCIASLFVGPTKKIFEVRYLDPSKTPESYYGNENQVWSLPVAVIVNAASASAAELLAGALRDLSNSPLVGERTFGKGSFQEGEYWTQNKKIALFETKGFYFLPSGQSPQLIGLEPDNEVKFDNITVGRESDLFLNPMQPRGYSFDTAKNMIAGECIEVEDGDYADDPQISKARQILFCANYVARTGQ